MRQLFVQDILNQNQPVYGALEQSIITPSGLVAAFPKKVEQPKSYLPAQQNIPEQMRQTPQYTAVLQKLKEVWSCFVDKQGQIFPQPPNAQCAQVWNSLHKTVPPQFHLQLMRDLLYTLRQQPAAEESSLKKYLPLALVGGGIALYFILS